MYRVLNESGGAVIPPYIEKWEKELDIKINEREAWLTFKRVNATSVNCKLSEMNYKCLARMYITPDRAHRIQRETSQLCWRGCKEIGTMVHIWWQCPEIKKY